MYNIDMPINEYIDLLIQSSYPYPKVLSFDWDRPLYEEYPYKFGIIIPSEDYNITDNVLSMLYGISLPILKIGDLFTINRKISDVVLSNVIFDHSIPLGNSLLGKVLNYDNNYTLIVFKCDYVPQGVLDINPTSYDFPILFNLKNITIFNITQENYQRLANV